MATIRKKGEFQWHAQIRRSGYPTQTRTFSTRKEADAWAREIEGKMDRGTFAPGLMDKRTTLGDLLRRYKKDVTAKRAEESKASESARIDRLLREEPDLCAYAVVNLRPALFRDYRDRRLEQFASRGAPGGRGQYKAVEHKPKLRKDGQPRKNAARPKAAPKEKKPIKPGTVKRELTLLKGVIQEYMEEIGLPDNPVSCAKVKRPEVNDERDVRLESEEINLLVEQCYRGRNPWLGPIVECAFEIGARRGNLLKLQWPDVNFDKKSAKLRNPKNSRSRKKARDINVGLSPRAIEILKALPRVEGELRVFPITADAVAGAFTRARKRVAKEHFRFHDTRHERASNLVEAGWSDTQVMAQTGHKDPKSLLRYVTLRTQSLGKALQDIEDFRALRSNPDAQQEFLAGLDPRMVQILIENAKLKAALKERDEGDGE